MNRWLGLLTSIALALAGCASHPQESTDAQASAPASQPPLRKLRFLLNSGYSGANSWFLLADERGYFRDAGIEVEFTDGHGAVTAAGRMVKEGFDVGYGDIQAAYEEVARDPKTAPVGVYMMMDRAPSAIILPAASPVREAAQLPGHTISGHPTDVALNTFEQFAAKTGIDPKSVTIVGDNGNWKVLLGLLESKKSDALFGYLTTSAAAVRAAGGKPEDELRFLAYRDIVPELYGSSVMVSAKLRREDPALVERFVAAVNRGVMDAVCKPDEAIAALVRRDPKQNAQVERGRLVDTVMEDMGGAALLARGVGDVDPQRVQAALELTARTRHLPRQPAVDEVFDRSFLPPLEQRKPCATGWLR